MIVADTKPGSGIPDPERIMVRARRREHLELLRSRHTSLSESEIIESGPGCDYRWRLIAPKPVVAQALMDELLCVDFKNFKNEAHRNSGKLGEDFVACLHEIWSVLRRIQT